MNKGVKVKGLPCGTDYLKKFLFFSPLLNTVGYYAKLFLEEPPNKIHWLFPPNGILLKNTMVMSLHGLRPSENKLSISKTRERREPGLFHIKLTTRWAAHGV